MRRFASYIETLCRYAAEAVATDCSGVAIDIEAAVVAMGAQMRAAHDRGNKLMFVGNGGSAGICSHMAIDYSKNGGMRALAFNDGAALTCLGNDLGYEQVFAKQIELHARAGDVLIAISSSGRSKNILNSVDAARTRGCTVFTLSGFSETNELRRIGDTNIYIDSSEYGFVEIGHAGILHAILDVEMGWGSKL